MRKEEGKSKAPGEATEDDEGLDYDPSEFDPATRVEGAYTMSDTLEYRWAIQKRIDSNVWNWSVDRSTREGAGFEWRDWQNIRNGEASSETKARAEAFAAASADAYGFA
jgi:hypothetical protein